MFPIMLSVTMLFAFMGGPRQCGHHHDPNECTACVEESPAVARQIKRLSSSGWIGRRKAARALRDFDWKSHPEAAEALAEALSTDDCGLVRQEAAESLAKMRPCLPTVHEAVARAARCDKGPLARHWAKKALKSLNKGCIEDCELCGSTDSPISGDSRLVPLPPGPSSEASPFDRGEDSNVIPLDPSDSAVPRSDSPPPLESPALPAPLGFRRLLPEVKLPR